MKYEKGRSPPPTVLLKLLLLIYLPITCCKRKLENVVATKHAFCYFCYRPIKHKHYQNLPTPENPATFAISATDKSNISINMFFCRHKSFATFATDKSTTYIIKHRVPPNTLLLLLPKSQIQA